MSDYIHIGFRREEGKVKSFSTASRPKGTTVRIELEVTDSWALQHILGQLHDAQHPPKPVSVRPVRDADIETLRRALENVGAGEIPALPVPALRLPYSGNRP